MTGNDGFGKRRVKWLLAICAIAACFFILALLHTRSVGDVLSSVLVILLYVMHVFIIIVLHLILLAGLYIAVDHRRKKKKTDWRRYITYPLAGCFILTFFGVPYVRYALYAIPVILLACFMWIGISISLCLTKTKLYLRPPYLVTGLCFAYGAFAFFFPAALGWAVVPETWEWPVGRTVSALSLPHDEWAVAAGYVSRVQIYDNDGRYLRGWFVPAGGGAFTVSASPPAPDGAERQEGLLVSVARGDKELFYTLKGELLSEREAEYIDEPRGVFAERTLTINWYEWPLTHPAYGWWMMLVGGISAYLVGRLEERKAKA